MYKCKSSNYKCSWENKENLMILKDYSWFNTKDSIKIEYYGFGIFDFSYMVKDRGPTFINGNV